MRSIGDGFESVYLSPHYDDVALSCGGTIHRQRRQGARVLVVTLFAAPPGADAPLSRLARELHAHMGAPGDVIEARRGEDLACMKVLAAEALALQFHDAIYRGRAGEWHYMEIGALFGPMHPADIELAPVIADALQSRVVTEHRPVVHAPLGVGGHVDHQLANRVGWLLAERGWPVSFYEDYPYSEHGYVQPVLGPTGRSVADAIAGQLGALYPRESEIAEDDLEHRIRGVHAYASQLELVFGDPASVGPRIRAHARSYRRGALIERFWVPWQPPAARK